MSNLSKKMLVVFLLGFLLGPSLFAKDNTSSKDVSPEKNAIGFSMADFLGTCFFLDPTPNISYQRFFGRLGVEVSLMRLLDRYWDETYEEEYYFLFFHIKPTFILSSFALNDNVDVLIYPLVDFGYQSKNHDISNAFPITELSLNDIIFGSGIEFIKGRHEAAYFELGMKKHSFLFFDSGFWDFWSFTLDWGVKIRF